ncbi:hypothetical protein HPB51_009158 [Rhipicephalus microplus]|uniref:Uncharacterized protein n=1 Tax=Rhipicephalus microplus TaxID=6941 RepID=A0A9J6EZG0_RHIMP|nr:hypothetical protein HPB51_009158 [Rhipicephalus microplus]
MRRKWHMKKEKKCLEQLKEKKLEEKNEVRAHERAKGGRVRKKMVGQDGGEDDEAAWTCPRSATLREPPESTELPESSAGGRCSEWPGQVSVTPPTLNEPGHPSAMSTAHEPEGLRTYPEYLPPPVQNRTGTIRPYTLCLVFGASFNTSEDATTDGRGERQEMHAWNLVVLGCVN